MWRRLYVLLLQRRSLANINTNPNITKRVCVAKPANAAVDDEQGDAEEEGDGADADADYDQQDEENLYAGPLGNFLGRGWRRGLVRYGSRFGQRGYGQRQFYAYQPGTVQ